jgi:hypothetical protein
MILLTDTDVSDQLAAFDIQCTEAKNIDFFSPEDGSSIFIRYIVASFIKIHGVIPKIFKLISIDNIWVYNHKY